MKPTSLFPIKLTQKVINNVQCSVKLHYTLFSRYPRGQRRDTLQKRGIYELRTYITSEYKPAALNARFANHTTNFFLKHGMSNVGYWTPYDRPESENTLIYLIQHESREKADKNWQAFSQDPNWKKVARDSQRQGKLLKRKPERLYLKPLDFSPAK